MVYIYTNTKGCQMSFLSIVALACYIKAVGLGNEEEMGYDDT